MNSVPISSDILYNIITFLSDYLLDKFQGSLFPFSISTKFIYNSTDMYLQQQLQYVNTVSN